MNVNWKVLFSSSDNEGSRNHMEDYYCSHIEKVSDKNIFSFFGVFDGHGGHEAAKYLKDNIVIELKNTDKFWSNNECDVKESIRVVFSRIQNKLWIERELWPHTFSGYKSTAGTTATIVILRNNSLFIGHVGDSAAILLTKKEKEVEVKELTEEHKPENRIERCRVISSGGFVRSRAGTERVVWNRATRLSNNNEEIGKKYNYENREYVPFLAVTRSLGDLWSYDCRTGNYHVSPEPDVDCIQLDPMLQHHLVLGSDGLWTVMNTNQVVAIINESNTINNEDSFETLSDKLMKSCLKHWTAKGCGADNISIITITLLPYNYTNQLPYLNSDHLNFIPDFSLYKPTTITSYLSSNTPREMLKQFCFNNPLIKHILIHWTELYWTKLHSCLVDKLAPNTYLPDLITHLETYNQTELENMFSAFPTSVDCLELLSQSSPTLAISESIKQVLLDQPPLSTFWLSFSKILKTMPDLSLTDILQDQPHLINSTIIHNKLNRHQLKRSSSSMSIQISQPKPKLSKCVSEHYQYKFSLNSNVTNAKLTNSGSSTPILNTSFNETNMPLISTVSSPSSTSSGSRLSDDEDDGEEGDEDGDTLSVLQPFINNQNSESNVDQSHNNSDYNRTLTSFSL